MSERKSTEQRIEALERRLERLEVAAMPATLEGYAAELRAENKGDDVSELERDRLRARRVALGEIAGPAMHEAEVERDRVAAKQRRERAEREEAKYAAELRAEREARERIALRVDDDDPQMSRRFNWLLEEIAPTVDRMLKSAADCGIVDPVIMLAPDTIGPGNRESRNAVGDFLARCAAPGARTFSSGEDPRVEPSCYDQHGWRTDRGVGIRCTVVAMSRTNAAAAVRYYVVPLFKELEARAPTRAGALLFVYADGSDSALFDVRRGVASELAAEASP